MFVDGVCATNAPDRPGSSECTLPVRFVHVTALLSLSVVASVVAVGGPAHAQGTDCAKRLVIALIPRRQRRVLPPS